LGRIGFGFGEGLIARLFIPDDVSGCAGRNSRKLNPIRNIYRTFHRHRTLLAAAASAKRFYVFHTSHHPVQTKSYIKIGHTMTRMQTCPH
jgi:hypothetical protein